MEHLYIEATAHTPEVYFNIDDDKLCLLGRSFPEDAASFYIPVVTWLENNIQEFTKIFAKNDSYNGKIQIKTQHSRDSSLALFRKRHRYEGFRNCVSTICDNSI